MDQPIIVCGLGRVGTRVLQYLQPTGLPVVVVDNKAKPGDPRLLGFPLVQGDCRQRDVLEAAGIARARGVLILTGDDLLNVATALMIRSSNGEVRIVLRMFNQNLLARLGQAVRNVQALSTSLLTAPILAMAALTGQELGRFRLEGPGEPSASGGAADRRHVAEVLVPPGSELEGRSIGDLVRSRDIQVVAHLPGQGEPHYLLDVPFDARLAAGDRLVVCGEPGKINRLLTASGVVRDQDLHWAGPIRRWFRMLWRTLAEIDTPVKICTGVLLGVVVASTLILHLGVEKYKVSDALFRTISIMATGADMHEVDYTAGMKVFVSVLRVVGAALMAAFTAIVTNYLIRARLAGALEVRRIPDSGHVVVIGLTPIGFRVVDELLDCQTQVVVIELAADNRFVATARRGGAAVIIGDATVAEVLKQAKAATARAVIAATNQDLANLEMALLVRELNPRQRVILLQSDPQLAQMLREAANVQQAVSVPALAAPAFVAALFGDRVLSVFLVGNRLLAVIDLLVGESDSFLHGQAVRAVSIDYHIQPVAVLSAGAVTPASQAIHSRLQPGQRLVGIIALADLERLLRRQPTAAGYAVEVSGFPISARDWLADMVRALRQVSAEEAEGMLDQLPLQLDSGLTRGQAEDLLDRMKRERVVAQLIPGPGVESRVYKIGPGATS